MHTSLPVRHQSYRSGVRFQDAARARTPARARAGSLT